MIHFYLGGKELKMIHLDALPTEGSLITINYSLYRIVTVLSDLNSESYRVVIEEAKVF